MCDKVTSQLRHVLSFFSDLTESAIWLEEFWKSLHINWGLEKIGKTQFSSIYWSAEFLCCCLPALREIVCDTEDPVNITVSAYSWQDFMWLTSRSSRFKPSFCNRNTCRNTSRTGAYKNHCCPRPNCKSHSLSRIRTLNLCGCLPILDFHTLRSWRPLLQWSQWPMRRYYWANLCHC